jgi:1-aminocyclopropane-1-carboxylate deaminase/D-cysteine desulfhydrase-like pyridoxal-dependent ACC family enzyme
MRSAIVPEMMKEVREQGGVPYVIPEGGSSAVGLL